MFILGADHTWIFVGCSVGGVFVIGTVAMVTMLYRRMLARSKYEQFDWPEADIEHFDSKYIRKLLRENSSLGFHSSSDTNQPLGCIALLGFP